MLGAVPSPKFHEYAMVSPGVRVDRPGAAEVPQARPAQLVAKVGTGAVLPGGITMVSGGSVNVLVSVPLVLDRQRRR